MYLLHLHDNKFLASIVGLIAVMFRQTNIIWTVFVAGLTARKKLIDWIKLEDSNQYERRSKEDLQNNDDNVAISKILKIVINSLRKDMKIFYLIIDILIASFFYIITILIFLGFVYINEGIVVGDRSHHTACLNFPQMFYFISFTCVFAFPYIITPSRIMSFIKSLISHYIKAFVIVLISLLLIHYFTYVHVYTLSDNRHFTFYVWSKIYNRHDLIKYLMTPLYMYSYWSCLSLLGHKDDIWKIIFGICIVAATIPQKLLEFRYFILPYIIFRLNIKEGSWLQLSAEMLLSIFINCTAVYLFVNKPFKWENSMELQRFMW
jgi:alpha-1,2-glucosyltransferase